ncbi:hypothetical protein SDJN02_08504, partial [Cucurbita argyrosperma subsp. argyrosperma]
FKRKAFSRGLRLGIRSSVRILSRSSNI